MTVATQPTGYACATSDGSGTIASADVTVNIGCTVNRGGGTGGFWIPSPNRQPTTHRARAASCHRIKYHRVFSRAVADVCDDKRTHGSWCGVARFISGTTPPASVTPAVMIYAAVARMETPMSMAWI